MTVAPRLRIGISQCLLGDCVRYDGGHKREALLADTLSQIVDWVPVCPEVEAGLGTPREPMRLEGPPDAPRLITITSKTDLTQTVAEFSARRVRELEALRLSGFVFKARSPSCGTGGVPLVNARGVESPDGAGLFARVFMAHFPLIPVEDEEHLRDPQVLQQFLERAAACRGAHAHG